MKVAKSNEDYFVHPKQIIKISKIPSGNLLDVGGGGEGVIAQIGRSLITAVDLHQSEIDEAKPHAPDANWLCADASDLDFPDNHFDGATAFFSGMYMNDEVLKTVFKEVHRLIPEDEKFWIWDAVISYEIGPFIIPLEIHIPSGRIISTGYGKRTVENDRTASDVIKILTDIGFDSDIKNDEEIWYFIKASRKK